MEPEALEPPKQEELLDFYQKLRKKIKNATKNTNGKRSNTVYSRFVDCLTVLPDLFHLGIKILFDCNVPA
jgi:hypothetical protein